jgi:hypothetical protein
MGSVRSLFARTLRPFGDASASASSAGDVDMRAAMSRHHRLLLPILAVLVSGGFLVPDAASAAGGSVPDEAEAHIQKGVELRRQNRDAEALAEFQKAVSLAPTARAKAQLGLAEMAVGHFEAAEKSLHDVLTSSAGDPWVEGHKATLTQALDRTLAQLGTLNVSGGPTGARVEINGNDQCAIPCSVHVQAGDVAVRVVSAGYLPILRTVTVTARQISNQQFFLVKTSAADTSETGDQAVVVKPAAPEKQALPSVPDSPTQRTPWPWVAAGAGVLAGGFGVFEAVEWSRKASDFNGRKDAGGNPLCGEGDPDSGGPGCKDLLHDAQQARLFAIGGIALGAGLGVLSWVLFSRETAAGPGPSQSSRRETILCSVGRGLTSVVCSARF